MENAKNITNVNDILTTDAENAIREFLTKQCIKVLINLFDQRLTNKELAETMQIASNTLSNILQRIKNSQLDLLIVEHEGRNTYYSLSLIGKTYVERYLLHSSLQKEKLKNAITQKGIMALNNMKNAWGKHWDIKLDEILFAHFDKKNIYSVDYSGQEENFQQFISVIEELKLEEQLDEVQKIYDMLDPFLVKRIEKSFASLMGVKYLCILYEMDWEMTLRLIDDFFDKRDYIKVEMFNKFREYNVESDDVQAAFNDLNEIIETAKIDKMTKDMFYEKWKNCFKPNESLAFYIATKYEVKC